MSLIQDMPSAHSTTNIDHNKTLFCKLLAFYLTAAIAVPVE